MKKIIALLLTAAIIAGSYSADAQLTDKTSLLNMQAIGVSKAALKAERDFWKKNGEGKGELWYKTPKTILATFSEKGISNMVVYDIRGNWVYTIRQYYEKDMPADVRKLVKSSYYDDTIGWIKEVWLSDTPDVPVYVVHVENNSSWKELSVHDGGVEVLQSFRK